MNEKNSPSKTIQSYLLSVQAAVNSIIDPTTLLPVQIPDFNAIYDAAGRMDTAPNPSDYAVVITSLLGRAAGYDCAQPGADYQLSFPNDHHLHPTMGAEWYYVGCHLNVTDSNGNDGRLGILLSIQKNRCVGQTAQHEANWSDTDTVICANVVTVTVDMANGEKKIVRRTRNCQWALTGGKVSYSAPGDDGFWFRCGNDSISGSLDVLPLNVIVDDGDNINMNLMLTAKEEMTGTPYFLQGMPSTTGNGGTGLTLVPKPGIYYSWPQLNVAGSITVEGIGYTIKSGTGWIDHQLLMGSLQNADGAHPVPFVEDPMPQDGWTWQFYNLNNGDAFTGASFVTGAMINSVSFSYGYYLRLVQGEWVALFIMGNNQLLAFTPFPAPIGQQDQYTAEVNFPITRSYQNLAPLVPGTHLSISGTAAPWYFDGTFNNPNWTIGSEAPADYIDNSTSSGNNGVGYLETIGFENVLSYRIRALRYLETGIFPG